MKFNLFGYTVEIKVIIKPKSKTCENCKSPIVPFSSEWWYKRNSAYCLECQRILHGRKHKVQMTKTPLGWTWGLNIITDEDVLPKEFLD